MTAKSAYFDTSALRRLYVHEVGSREVARLRQREGGIVRVTRFGWVELINSVAMAEFRDRTARHETAAIYWQLQHDLAEGLLRLEDCSWRTVMDQAAELSRLHTPALGTRALDVLHVASALELDARRFVTCDTRQAGLAAACGLTVIQP